MNPGATVPIWPEPTAWKLDRYFDKAGSLSLDMTGSHGMADRAIVEAYYADEAEGNSFSDIPFRGFVLPSDDKGADTSRLTIPAIEKMLDYRFTQLHRWPAGTTLNKILASDWPVGGETPGYLCIANHMIQQGSFIPHNGNWWKLPQGGTNFLGDLHAKGDHVYIDSVQCVYGVKYSQDADYLYIWTAKNPYYSVILVEGSYDTGIRLGTISLGTSTFAQSWRSAGTMISREIPRLLMAFGLEFQYSHNVDGYTYLNASAAIGRGANSAEYPTYKYDKNFIIKVRRNTTAGNAPVHALRGLGIGKGASRQAFTSASFPQGLRFVVLEEYSNQFAAQLAGTVTKRYADMQDTNAWQVTTEDDPGCMPGDYCKIVPEFESPCIERIKQISESSDNAMILYLGQRPRDTEDAVRAKMDVRDQLQRDLDLQYAAFSISGQENVDNTYPCNIILKVPAENWDTEQDSKWLLSVTFNAFEASIAQATTAAVNHGASGTTTHAGSGGSHNDHDLNVAGHTEIANEMPVLLEVPPYETDNASGPGSHSHGLSIGSGEWVTTSAHTHDYGTGTEPGTADPHDDHTIDENPQQDAVLTLLKQLKAGFGSLAYLTATIKIINATYPSGVSVPGSPFIDIALTEAVSDIDVSGLVIAGNNTVQVSIVKYGGTGSVACRANVTLSGKHIIDTFY